MTIYESWIVYPEGGTQEIEGTLSVNTLVDLNGIPLRLPLSTCKMIAYRVYKKRVTEERGQVISWYYLELVGANELQEYVY